MTETSSEPTRPSRKPKRSTRKRVLIIIAAVLGFLLVSGAAVAAYLTYTTAKSISNIPRETDAFPTGSRPPSATPTPGTTTVAVNILLIGSDKRAETENGRSDSFMILHVSGDRKSAYLVSFPRDMWVAIPGHGTAKINAAYSYGGTALAVQTIENLTGVRIDHTVTTDFNNFVGLVEVLGGVTVDNPVASKGKDNRTQVYYDWPVGPVTLDGQGALAFARQRYELPNGDLDRALRQRALVKALALKVASPEILGNPVRLGKVISTVSTYVTVDSGFTDDAIYALATSTKISSKDQVSMLQAPITGFGTSADGQSIDVVDVPGVAALGKALSTDTMAAYAATHPK